MLKTITRFLICFLIQFTLITSEIHKVIIIGGGPSGIAAATKLLKNNISDIRILEAENRIGGRINSVKFGDAYVDLGGEWCHGQENNIVYDLTKDYNILKITKWSNNIWYSSHGLLDEQIQEEIANITKRLKESTLDNNKVKFKNISVAEYFLQDFNNTVLKKYQNDSVRLNILKDVIDYFDHDVTGMNSAFSWNDVGINTNYVQTKGELYLNWNGMGFKTILDILTQKYPDPTKNALPIENEILLNKEVTSINWKMNSKQIISIKCQDGSQYEANYVIFTPSVGVLKAQHSKLFEPQLPLQKITAIQNIGFGAVVKVVLQFPTRWWKDDDYSFSFMWDTKDKQTLLENIPNEPAKNGASWLTDFNGLVQGENNPKVLYAWLCGQNVPKIETLTDQQIENGIMYAVRHFLGKDYNISNPIAMLRSSWWSNPHFRGTWSYDSVKGMSFGKKLQDDLAEPLSLNGNSMNFPQLLFGGEATHTKYYSTVHGAIESGHREANRIIESILSSI